MSKGLLFEEGLFVLLVADVLLHCVFFFFHALGLLGALSTGLKDAVHLGAQSDIFCDWAPGALIFHLAKHRLVPHAGKRLLLFLTVNSSCCLYLFFGTAIMLVTCCTQGGLQNSSRKLAHIVYIYIEKTEISIVAWSCCSSIKTFRICLSQNWKTTVVVPYC